MNFEKLVFENVTRIKISTIMVCMHMHLEGGGAQKAVNVVYAKFKNLLLIFFLVAQILQIFSVLLLGL